MKKLIDRNTLIILMAFFAIYLGSNFLPSRRTLLNFFGEGKNVLNYVDAIVLLAGLFIYSFFYGWLTNSIVKKIKEGHVSLFDSLTQIKSWFPRSLMVILIGWGGVMISSLAFGITSDFLSTFFGCLFGGLWITLTFTLYPTVISSQEPIIKSLVEAFSINIRSVNKWFHLLLLLFFFSGGITFLWIPEYWAHGFWGMSENYSGWMVHFQWLGGYSFQSFWYSDLTKWLFLNPPFIAAPVVMFLNILIATFVKIRVTEILFENGYLTENFENKKEAFNHISTVQETY